MIITLIYIFKLKPEKILYKKSHKNYRQNFEKIFLKRKRPYQYKFLAKPFTIQNTKKSHRVIKNQKSPSGWHKRQCADFNNKDKVLTHEARYKSIAVHFPYQRRSNYFFTNFLIVNNNFIQNMYIIYRNI